MLNLTATAALAAGSVPITRADYPAEVLAQQPLTYWRFNENVTTPAYDVATNWGAIGPAGNGRYYDNYTRPVAGAIAGDTAVAFNNPTLGTAYFGAMRVPNNAALNPGGAFSLEFWAKPSNDTAALLSPVNSMSFITGRIGYLFYQNGATWQFRVGVSSTTTASLINGGVIVSNQWQHVVGVFTPTTAPAGTMTLFVDGVQVATGTGNYEANTNAPFCIGATSSPNRTFDGTVDEVAFYSAALSASQIAAHFAARTTNAVGYATQILGAAPAGYWRLNEPLKVFPVATNSGSLAAVANGKYIDGATNSAGPSGDSFPGFEANNRAVSFDGTNSYVQAGSLGLSGPLTISAWVNPNSLSGDRAIAGENASYTFKLGGSELRFTTPGILDHTSVGASVVPNVWQQVAITFVPGATEGAKFYLNGQLVSSVNASALVKGTTAFWVGKNQWAEQFFDGAIDEVAVFDKVLTAGRIASLYFTAIGSNAVPYMVSDPPVVNPPGTIYTTTPFTIIPDVAGALPMFYQWRHAGTNLPGATTLNYSKASAGLSDAGDYEVVITNAFGAVTSLSVTLAVDPAVPPTIDQQPVSRSVYVGGQASFSVAASGTTPLTYRWKHAGTNLPGATNATLIVTNCAVAQTGTYSVGLTNVAGGLVSSSATLDLVTPVAGSYEEIIVTNKPLAYWRLNESSGAIAFDFQGGHDGTVTDSITLGTAAPASPLYPGLEAGNTGYSFNGTDSYVEAGSLGLAGPLTISAWVNPNGVSGDRAIASENTSYAFKLGGNELVFTTPGLVDHTSVGAAVVPNVWQQVAVTFVPGATAGAKFYLNGQLISSVNASALVKGTSAFWIGKNQWTGQIFDGALDEVVLYDKALSADTIATMYAIAAYGTITSPIVTKQPASSTMVVGSTVVLSAGVTGSLPLTYQWKNNGVSVPGATSVTLTLSNLYYTSSGSYVLYATNGAGWTNTSAATVTVMPPPTFANITNDLVLHLQFEDNTDDTSGRGNHGIAIGLPTYVGGAIGTKALHYSTDTAAGIYNYVTLNTPADLTFSANVNFSVAYWVRFTGTPSDLPFLCTAIRSYGNAGITFAPGYNTGTWSYYLAGTTGPGVGLYGPALINDGGWHSLVHTFDRTGDGVTYLDGVLVDTRSFAAVLDLDNYQPMNIGQDPTGSYAENGSADIDDIGIWRRVLNQYEAASIYAVGHAYGRSFDTYGPVRVLVQQTGGNVEIIWQAGTLQQNSDVNNPAGWTPVPGAVAPYYKVSSPAAQKFYRVKL